MSDIELEPTRWKIFGERLVDENPFVRLSIASVGLPDGTEFEQYVMRMRRTATTAVVNDHGQVLLMWRHRLIIDRWVWECLAGTSTRLRILLLLPRGKSRKRRAGGCLSGRSW